MEPPPEPRGDADHAFASAAVQLEAEYHLPVEHHNPMEPFATTVIWEHDGTMTVYDKTQGVQNNQAYVHKVFGLSTDEVRVVSPFVGGAFGSGSAPPVSAVSRGDGGARAETLGESRADAPADVHLRPSSRDSARLALGATSDGTLEAVMHEAVAETSQFEDYSENVVNWSGVLYQCDNVKLGHKVVPLDLHTPIDMRAPGAAWGVYALECAMDELAYKLNIDPLELRLKNYAERDQNEDKPFSSKELRECYRQGAEKFGWAKRHPQPRSMRDGDHLIGWGMATGVWEAL